MQKKYGSAKNGILSEKLGCLTSKIRWRVAIEPSKSAKGCRSAIHQMNINYMEKGFHLTLIDMENIKM
ncbi:hypothetical protein [Alkaliflexus imshenetskii]|uniref:hypothetical protein n=1 Tax=Alkaliflexus imshenetskii TaxID=286730 RepID=UPI000478813B|nr:hypothetical protein [Alkaliflexus imshenetskii]